MASLDFPSSPINGQTYSLNGITYYYDSTVGAWLTQTIATTYDIPTLFGTTNAAFGLANTVNTFAYGVAVNTTAAFAFANGVSTNTTAAFAFANGVSTNTTAAFAKANTALANTTNTVFSGNISITGTATLGSSIVSGSVIETKVAMAANDVNLLSGSYFTKTIGSATTFTVSNVPATGNVASFILDLTNGGAGTITWWSGTKWAGGTAPTLTASGRDVIGFFTHDGGTTWSGLVLGKDVK